MSEYYQRFADPRATFVMIEIKVQTERGFSQPFNLRITEEELHNMIDSARRQAMRSEWPPAPMGVRYRVPSDFYSRSYPNEPFGSRYERPRFGGPFFNEDWFATYPGEEKFTPPKQDRPKPPPKPEPPKNSPPTQEAINLANKIRLATLAGQVWTDGLDLKTLWKKAQRRCHPDVDTGSHELWLELEGIAIFFGFVKGSARASRPNYSGRSGG